MHAGQTIDADEINRFSHLAQQWWSPHGPMRALHQVNPVRLAYIRQTVQTHFNDLSVHGKPFAGLSMVDLGCGGGILTEPLARLGAHVTGVDASSEAIRVAQSHARQKDLAIVYTCAPIETIEAHFDVVCAMEILEHVTDPAIFIAHCARLLKKDGLFIFSTINRTAMSFLQAIIGAEYLLQLVPRGTHQWSKLITPGELENMCKKANLYMQIPKGLIYRPWAKTAWEVSADTRVNYMGHAIPI